MTNRKGDMGKWINQVIVGGLAVFMAAESLAVDNPLSVELTGSMVRYNGVYYGLGAGINGAMWASSNLVDWASTGRMLNEEAIESCELLYRNGLFYLYVQGQGYAVSAYPAGPFSEWIESVPPGEDLRLFQNGDGMLFAVSRKLGSKREGEIWMQRLDAPWKPAARPKQLLDGRQGKWDSLESSNLGQPEMLNYRGNYYLLYAANSTGSRASLREIGVAMNESVKRFDNSDKVADPLMVRNTERLARVYKELLPSGEYSEWKARYSFKPPAEGWMNIDFDLKGWRTGKGGFGDPFEEGEARIHALRTKWESGPIWIRRTFDLSAGQPQTPVLHIRYEGAVQVFLNGAKIFESSDPLLTYINVTLSETARAAFRPEGNVLAVRAEAQTNAVFRAIDFGLFDAGDAPVEPTVYGLEAPRVIEGPNGFERWMAYRAYWNGVPGSGLDRVFFFGSEMVVDGPTTASTQGYHPPPAQPTFSDLFESNETSAWVLGDGDWQELNGALRQSATTGRTKAYLRQKPAVHYLFETHFRLPETGKGEVGVVAYSDGERDLVISLNPAEHTWTYRLEPGSLEPDRFKLPKQFRWKEAPPGVVVEANPLHRLRVTKNAGDFEVMLDGFKLTPKPIKTQLFDPAVPGLYCRNMAVEFDGVTYTVGWDEHGEHIAGWGAAANGTLPGGEWRLHEENGLEQKRYSDVGRVFKGDLLDQYEFTVNARTRKLEEGKMRLYGVFPVFAGADNYLKAMIDTHNRELVVSGIRDGQPVGPFVKSLARRIPHRHLHDQKTAYRDVAAWIYRLRSESIVEGLEIRWLAGEYAALQQEFFIPLGDIAIRYARLPNEHEPMLWRDGRFRAADEPKPQIQQPGILNAHIIRPETGSHVGFGIYDSSPDDANFEVSSIMSRPQETLVNVAVESSYFFRCVKLKDRVIIELNGQSMLEIEGEWPPSQVGLLTEGQPCFFDGIMLMHLPSHP